MTDQPIIYSPARVRLLMHYHAIIEPIDNPDSICHIEETANLKDLGAIEPDPTSPSHYKTTPLGQAWVQAICNVPMPTREFIDEMGRVINFA